MNDDDDFTTLFFTYGIILRESLDKIQKLKTFLSENKFNVCYQKTSAEKLYIMVGDAPNDTTR